MCIVKIILLFGPLPSHAAEKSIFIGKGEQKSIIVNDLEHYSLGNPEVLSKRLRYKKGKLLIKGRRVGFSDLIIWSKKKKKQTYHIYVLSKQESLKLAQASSVLEDLGLTLNFKGKILIVSGEITNREDLKEVRKLKKIFKNQIILRTNYSKSLAKNIITDIYLKLSNLGINNFSCTFQNQIWCKYHSLKKQKKLEAQFTWADVQFEHLIHPFETKNFKIKMHFIQTEHSNGENFSIGLQRLNSSIMRFIQKGKTSLIEKNTINIGNHQYKFSTLAQPEVKTILNKENTLKVGFEIPTQERDANRNVISTQWKEVGFSMVSQIGLIRERLFMKYSIHLSDHDGARLSSSHYKGEQFIALNQLNSLTKVSVTNKKKIKESLPIIGRIPILNFLTSSSSIQSANKVISVFYEVTYE